MRKILLISAFAFAPFIAMAANGQQYGPPAPPMVAHPPVVNHGPGCMLKDHAEEKFTEAHQFLGITPAQEKDWNTFKANVNKDFQPLVAECGSPVPPRPANFLDGMKMHLDQQQKMLDVRKNFIRDAQAFWPKLSAEQQGKAEGFMMGRHERQHDGHVMYDNHDMPGDQGPHGDPGGPMHSPDTHGPTGSVR